jgi:hypothetical protein
MCLYNYRKISLKGDEMILSILSSCRSTTLWWGAILTPLCHYKKAVSLANLAGGSPSPILASSSFLSRYDGKLGQFVCCVGAAP